jgi:hypothetical protein
MNDQVDRGSKSKPPMPRWVKVFAAIALLAIIALLVIVISGGEHGPGRHIGATQPAHQHA